MITNKSILITGANGYIASNLKNYLSNQYKIESINRNNFDLRDQYSTKKWFEDKYFDTVIHTAICGGNRLHTEDSTVIHNNLLMFDNLLDAQTHYSKMITFGSGAEFSNQKTPYGLSKKIINMICNTNNKLYNLRLYGLFDYYEHDRRFIKSNIIRYLNNQNLIIHQNKYMDFIYFPDFVQIVKQYLDSDNLPRIFNCVYEKKFTLIEIAELINSLDNHTSYIEVKSSINDEDYIGTYYNIGIEFDGLEEGVRQTYRKIKNEKSMVRSK